MTTDGASRVTSDDARTFRIAPMSNIIRALTVLLLVIPVGLAIGAAAGVRVLLIPLALIVAIYAWVWLRFRPGAFVIHPGFVEIAWPLKRRTIPRSSIVSCRIVDAPDLKREVGWGARVGAGGVWGGFGWLWTQRRGIVQMYVSRTDGFVWIERGSERPWLITPERPEEFVREILSGAMPVVERAPWRSRSQPPRPTGARRTT
jgi:Bacterial PH domain